MKKPLQILMVEDNPADAKMLLAELRAADFEPTWKRVETESDFLAELENSPDIILSDYVMPEFSGLRAAELLQASGREIPFILISGTVGEEVAVEAMRQGATDYLLKDRLTRLGSAVERALREAQASRERKQKDDALRLLGAALAQATESIMITDARLDLPGPAIVFVNSAFSKMTGYTADESMGKTPRILQGPRTDKAVLSQLRKNLEQGERFAGATVNYRKDGTEFDIEWEVAPVHNSGGEITHFVAIQRDITERKARESELASANRALKMLSTCNEALVRAEDEQELLARICRIAVEKGSYRMAWVGYAQDDGAKSIKPVAHAGAEDGYLSKIKVSWNEHDPQGQGPAGQVIRTGQAFVCADFSRDPRLAPWHALGERHGYRGAMLLPLRDGPRTFGFLGLYRAVVNEPGAGELKLLQELADNLAFGIVHLRARLAQQRLQKAVLKVAAGVSATTGAAFFKQLAFNMAEALGGQAGFVSQLHTGESTSASTLAAVVDGMVIDNFDYVIEGTPCENLVTSQSCVIAQHVAEQFPQAERLAALGAQAYVGHRLDGSNGQPLGHLFVVFREPLQDTAFVTSTMQIFAARAASELERMQTDAHVREQAALIDEARDAIVVHDLDHRITFWSKGAERLYGWSAAEVQGSVLPELLAADPTTFAEANRTLRKKGEWNGEILQTARKGTVLTVDGRWTLLRDAQGRPRSVMSVDTDITERKKIEKQFLRSQRMESIGTLAGGVAHDLNNALAPILMGVGLLKMQYPEESELLDLYEISAKRAADMVRQLLTFAKGAEGDRTSIDMGRLARDLENMMKSSFPKNIQVAVSPDPNLPTVLGDATQLHQVLLNLCVNARDAMPQGGSLTLKAQLIEVDVAYASHIPDGKPGTFVLLKVSDTGTGIPPEILDRIFDPFFTTKGPDKGTGLGLSTVSGIVKGHGGFLHAYSQLGHGSTFAVYLPADLSGVASESSLGAPTGFLGSGETVLFVDDEESVRKMSIAVLEKLNFVPLTATDGLDALLRVAENRNRLNAIITDLHMPHMDGLAFVQALRRVMPDIPVVIASGLLDEATALKFKALGVTSRLDKPFTEIQLAEVMQGLLSTDSEPLQLRI